MRGMRRLEGRRSCRRLSRPFAEAFSGLAVTNAAKAGRRQGAVPRPCRWLGRPRAGCWQAKRPAERREELPRSRFRSGRARRQGRRLPCAPHVHEAARARRPQGRSARQGFEAFTRQAPAAPPRPWGMSARALARLPTCLGSAVRRLCRCYHCRDSSPARRFGLAGRSGRLRRRQPLFAAPAFAWQASLPAAAAAAAAAASLPALHAPPAALACGARGRRAPVGGPPAAAKMRIFLPPHAGPTPLLSPPAPIPSTARAPAVPYGGQCTRRQQRAAAPAATQRRRSSPLPAAATRRRPASSSHSAAMTGAGSAAMRRQRATSWRPRPPLRTARARTRGARHHSLVRAASHWAPPQTAAPAGQLPPRAPPAARRPRPIPSSSRKPRRPPAAGEPKARLRYLTRGSKSLTRPLLCARRRAGREALRRTAVAHTRDGRSVLGAPVDCRAKGPAHHARGS